MKTFRQKGSALIITMLIVAGISVAAYGLSRIYLADVRTAGSLEDSTLSYYLAEAGIEEGLLRYRINRTSTTLNEYSRSSKSLGLGSYSFSTSLLTDGQEAADKMNGNYTYSFDTIDDNNPDYPSGRVAQDKTVEIATPTNAGEVEVAWRWEGAAPGGDCGVEITDVLTSGLTFNKELNQSASRNGFYRTSSSNRASIRVKPLCDDLEWVAFGANNRIGRTIQSVDVTGFVGRAKRRLLVDLSRRSGQIIGIFDFVLGSDTPINR